MGKIKTTTTTSTSAYPLIITTILLVALPCLTLTAQSNPISSASSPASDDCFNSLINLSDCLTFVEEGSNLTKPDKGCCPEFSNLLNTQPVCLCQLLGDSNKIGIPIDTKKALKLPSACGVNTPPVSLCSAIGVHVGAPAPSKGPLSLDEQVAANTAPGDDGNGSPRNLDLTQHFLFGLAIILFTNLF